MYARRRLRLRLRTSSRHHPSTRERRARRPRSIIVQADLWRRLVSRPHRCKVHGMTRAAVSRRSRRHSSPCASVPSPSAPRPPPNRPREVSPRRTLAFSSMPSRVVSIRTSCATSRRRVMTSSARSKISTTWRPRPSLARASPRTRRYSVGTFQTTCATSSFDRSARETPARSRARVENFERSCRRGARARDGRRFRAGAGRTPRASGR